MPGTVISKFDSLLREEFTSGLDAHASVPITRSLPSESRVYNASSSPVVSVVYSDKVPLIGGAKTIDLTALANGNLTAIDLTGLTIYYLELFNTGANAMTFVTGAANGYNVFGDALGKVVLGANARMILDDPAGSGGAVGAADLGIDVTGTLVQEFWIGIGAGA